MKVATTFAAMMIAGILPLASASEPASAKVFDWSLTGPAPNLGGVPFPGSGTIDASPTESTGVWSIDAITGVINGSEITGTSTFRNADNLLFTNGFAFVSTVGISFETAAGKASISSVSLARKRRRLATPMANPVLRANLASGPSR
jgi:hypothetical protein